MQSTNLIIFSVISTLVIGTNFVSANTADELFRQAELLSVKANDFITAQIVAGNSAYLAVIKRDALAIQAMANDLREHLHGGKRLSDEEIRLIEIALRQYEHRIAEDIEDVKRETDGDDNRTTTTTEPTTPTPEQTTESTTPTAAPTIAPDTTPTTITTTTTTAYPIPSTTPNANIVVAAEDLLAEARRVRDHYSGIYLSQLNELIDIVTDLVHKARDPTDPTDKFLLAVVLGNQVVSLRGLLQKIATEMQY